MNDRTRQFLVVFFAIAEVIASFGISSALEQGTTPSPMRPYFLPIDITFIVWGFIYLGALAYAVYQAQNSQRERPIHRRIGGWAILNMALCTLWLPVSVAGGSLGEVGFQPIYTAITAVIIVGMLVSMTAVFIILRKMDSQLTTADRWLAQVPMTIYFAWLNVATVANPTAALYAYGVTAGQNGALIAAVMLVIAAVITCAMVLYSRPGIGTLAYILVILWALLGIYLNNTERAMIVSNTAAAVAVVFSLVSVYHFINRGGRLMRVGVAGAA
jgi:hypothetical protein